MLTDCWNMSGRIKSKLCLNDMRVSKSRISICIDYLIGWLKHGYSLVQYEDYEIYKYSDIVQKNIVTNRRALKLEELCNNPDGVKWLNDKKLFNKRFSKYVTRKWVQPSSVSKDEFVEFFKDEGKVIVKPIGGEKGEGIYIKELDNPIIDLANLYMKLSKKDYIVEEVIEQHPSIRFNRNSVNTIRMYTILDPNNKAHLIKSVLRVGALNQSVDNYHCGGTIWPLNTEGGFIECPGKSLKDIKPIYSLPFDGTFMLGYKIPNYDNAVLAVCDAAESIPEVRYLGWDVAVTSNGIEIIEANSSPDNDFHCIGNDNNYYGKMLALINN